jgi:hypothetical protein
VSAIAGYAPNEAAARPLDDAGWKAGGRRRFHHSSTALALHPRLTFAEWRTLGAQLTSVHTSSAWWIGDWVVFGHARYKQRYRAALKQTNLDYQTLRNYAWVAANVPRERRVVSLSFQHHAEVAAMSPEDQQMWLMRAKLHNWSRNRLRRQIRIDRDARAEGDGPRAASLTIFVPLERRQRWLAAAGAANQPLQEWVAEALDGAANAILVLSAD